MFEVVTLKSLGLEVTGMRKWFDIVEHVVPIVISYKMNSIYKRNVSKFYKFLMFEVVTSEKPWFGGHRYEEVTWYCWICSPDSHIIQNEQYLWEKCFEIQQFLYVLLGIKVQQPSWTPSWIPPLCPTSWMSTQVFFNRLWVPYKDQESKLGDIWLHTGPPSAPGLSTNIIKGKSNLRPRVDVMLNWWSFERNSRKQRRTNLYELWSIEMLFTSGSNVCDWNSFIERFITSGEKQESVMIACFTKEPGFPLNHRCQISRAAVQSNILTNRHECVSFLSGNRSCV